MSGTDADKPQAPSAKLLPCPFCMGSASMDQDGGRRGDGRQSCIVVCTDCGCQLETGEEGDRCGGSWNSRSNLPSGYSWVKDDDHAGVNPVPAVTDAMVEAALRVWLGALADLGNKAYYIDRIRPDMRAALEAALAAAPKAAP